MNGTTIVGPSGGDAYVLEQPDDEFQLVAGAVSFLAQLTSFTAFPVQDTPGGADLSCTHMCTFIFSYGFGASIDGINFNYSNETGGYLLNNFSVSDSNTLPAVAVPEPSTLWLCGSGLLALFATKRRALGCFNPRRHCQPQRGMK